MVVDFINEIYVYPTDSVWGIGADAKSSEKNKWIRNFKGRDSTTPFSVLFYNIEQLESYLDLSSFKNRELLEKVLKMQSTFLLPLEWLRSSDLGPWIYAQSSFIGIRVLELPWIKQLTINGPITTTSCNFTGNPPLTNLKDAKEFFDTHCSNCSFIVPDCDIHENGKPSTIIKFNDSNFEIVREGDNVGLIRELLEI